MSPLWIGAKRTGTYRFLYSFAAAAAAAVASPQLLKLMATQWHLMAVDAAVSLRIASNSIKVEIYKLVVSNFMYR